MSGDMECFGVKENNIAYYCHSYFFLVEGFCYSQNCYLTFHDNNAFVYYRLYLTWNWYPVFINIRLKTLYIQ
jgi:hypothetical protein